MKYKITTSVMAITAAISCFSAPASAEDLREALAKAYVGNPTLQAQRAALRATDESVARSLSGFLPRLQGSANVSRSDTNSLTTRTDDGRVVNDTTIVGRNQSFQARLDQSVFNGFRDYNSKRENDSVVKSGRAQLLSTEQQVLTDTVTAYMNVIRDTAVLDLNNNNVQVLERQLEASNDRFRVGEITRTDVAQSEAALAGAVSSRIQAEANLEVSRAAYQRATGDYPGTLDSAPPLPTFPATHDEAQAVAKAENPIITAAVYNEEAAKFAVKGAKGALLPTIDGFAQFDQGKSPSLTFDPIINGFVGARNSRRSRSYGLQLVVPLYQSGAEYSDIRRAKQIKSQRILQIREAERQVQELVRNGWELYRAAVASTESNRSQVNANEIALDGVRQEAAVGSRTTLDVLDAEQALLNSRVNLVTAERDVYIAGFTLLSALGRLNAIALDLPVEIYDPTEYYNDIKWQLVGWGTE